MTRPSSSISAAAPPWLTASATVTGSDRRSQISAAANIAANTAIPADKLTLMREERIQEEVYREMQNYSRGSRGTASPSFAYVSCGDTRDASATMAVASFDGSR